MKALVVSAVLIFAAQQYGISQTSPLVGRWGINMTGPNGSKQALWLGVAEKNGAVDVWFQPSGGNVRQIKDAKVDGAHLTFTAGPANDKNPATVWDVTAKGDKLAITQKRGDKATELTGFREPELKRGEPKAWSKAEPLFNGKDLSGWEPMGSDSHWVVENGLLTNTEHGANLKSKRTFTDFKVHFEANCPEHANSGFYLCGRYEVQLEYEPLDKNPPERRMGAIYGRIAPSVELPRKPGDWDVFDVTLTGRTVTIVRNGVTTIDHKEIEGITGGALDANEGDPGPFYIQGDHTGGLKFRNITVSVPK
jgi:hypothetical protein